MVSASDLGAFMFSALSVGAQSYLKQIDILEVMQHNYLIFIDGRDAKKFRGFLVALWQNWVSSKLFRFFFLPW